MTEVIDPVLDRTAAAADGVDLEEPAYEDYFGFAETVKWYFPDKLQYIEFKKMNEGDRKRYQQETRSDLIVERATGNARMKADPGTERWTLLESAVTGWNLKRKTPSGWNDVPFSRQAFQQWLGSANTRLVDDFEKLVRKSNPWLLAEMTVEDIDKELASLQEMREVAVKRELGEDASSVR